MEEHELRSSNLKDAQDQFDGIRDRIESADDIGVQKRIALSMPDGVVQLGVGVSVSFGRELGARSV